MTADKIGTTWSVHNLQPLIIKSKVEPQILNDAAGHEPVGHDDDNADTPVYNGEP